MSANSAFEQYVCEACNYIYDEALGDIDSGLPAGTRMQDIPEDWFCPVCGVKKTDFKKISPVTKRSSQLATPNSIKQQKGVVVLGGGHAGWTAIEALRDQGYTGSITLVSACNAGRYSKPQLSGLQSRGGLRALKGYTAPEDAARSFDVQLMCNTWALQINRASKRILTTRGSLSYETLILALGASPRMPAFKGDGNQRLHVLNDLRHYTEFNNVLNAVKKTAWEQDRSAHVAIVGAGLVGCELANDFANAGLQVSLIDQAALPLASRLSKDQAIGLKLSLQGLGVRFIGQAQISHVGAWQDHGAAIEMELGHGLMDVLKADVAVACMGIVPRLKLPESMGLVTQRGILVDNETLMAAEHVFALGDCVEINGQLSATIEPIQRQANCIASHIVGKPTAYEHRDTVWVVKTPCCPLIIRPAEKFKTP
jgi:rubredoxin-NAD+ reductase